MLKTTGISYTIAKQQILKNISVEFMPGEFAMILGPNGSGKSSFLKIFSGEISQYSGTVLYNHLSLKNIPKEALAKYRAVMSQQPELSFPLTVEEVVMMGRYPHFNFSPNKRDFVICDEVINLMKLHAFKERNYMTLSGGEKQRVQYARVLAQVWEKPAEGCRYLFLDEPLNNLDIKYQQEFLQIAQKLKDANTVLIAVMHDINLAVQHADTLVILKEGRLFAKGKPGEILTASLIENVFGVHSTIINNPVTNNPLVVYT